MPLAALKKKSAPSKPALKHKPTSAPPVLAAPARMQAKLEVGPVGDRFEQVADRTADSVMRMPDSAIAIATAQLQISRKCAVCEREETDDKRLQKKSAGPAEANIGEAPASVHAALRSPGQPLDKASRAYFEPRFGQEFGDVRVHTGMVAAQSARDVSAHAYTVGQNIVFAAGRFAPATQTGRRLIAHELTHVVQQHATANGSLSLGRPGDLAERDAERTVNGVMSGRQEAFRSTESVARVLRRSPDPPTQPTPSPPTWLPANATHLQGDIWEVHITGLGRSPVGPHDQMQGYLRVFNQNRPPNVERMVSAHIIGGEHMKDLGWEMPYEKAPCIGVAESLHNKWSGEMNELMSAKGPIGSRRTKVAGRSIIDPSDVKYVHDEVYKGFPELQEMSKRIVNLEAKRIMGANYGMPKPTSPMEAHEGGMPKPTSPMEAHKGGAPKPTSPMEAHRGGAPKPTSPMESHQGGMPKPSAPTKTTPPSTTSNEPTGTPAKTRQTSTSKSPVKAPTKPTDVPTGKPKPKTSVPSTPAVEPTISKPLSATGQAAVKTFNGLVNQYAGKATKIATSDPQIADTYSDLMRIMDAKALIDDPKGFGAQKLANYFLNSAFTKLALELAEQEAAFWTKYPDAASLSRKDVGFGQTLDSLKGAYRDAIKGLQTPKARRDLTVAFVMLGLPPSAPQSEIDKRLDVINAMLANEPDIGPYVQRYNEVQRNYFIALGAVWADISWRVAMLDELPKEYFDQIRRRGDVLVDTSKILDEFAEKLALLSALPGVDDALWLVNSVAEGVAGLGGELQIFAADAGQKKRVYKIELDRLAQEIEHISNLHGAFDVIYGRSAP